MVGFCGSLDPEDNDGSAFSTGFAPGPCEPSGATAIFRIVIRGGGGGGGGGMVL